MNDDKDPAPKNGYQLPEGCYFVQYRPKEEIVGVKHFDGVFRYTPDNPRVRASADLYAHRVEVAEDAGPVAGAERKKAFPEHCKQVPAKMPVFPRDAYTFYLQVQQVTERCPDENSVSLRFQVHQFDARSKRFIHRGGRTAILSLVEKPRKGIREPCYVGRVVDEGTSETVGEMWISLARKGFVREAVVQIDSDGGIPFPLTNESKDRNWAGTFEKCGWKVTTKPAKAPVQDPDPKHLERAWTDAELHEKMQKLSGDPAEAVWRYHLLCVGTFANPQYERGVMYDVGGSDLNQSPREGAAIAAGWKMTDWSEKWPALARKGLFHEAKDLYFRTAVHEIGHAMGLEHSHDSAHFMNTTDALERLADSQTKEIVAEAAKDQLFADARRLILEKSAASSGSAKAYSVKVPSNESNEAIITAAGKLAKAVFPENIKWDFSDGDIDRLQHGPDVMVRSGTFVEGAVAGFGDSELKWADGLALELTPLLASVPYGAPVRVRVTLRNKSDQKQEVPLTLNLKSGCVEGTVFGPGGQPARPFYPVMRCMDSDRDQVLDQGKALHHSMTLLRGHEGALFTRPGDHVIRVRVSWNRQGRNVYLENEVLVRVEAAPNLEHEIAALKLLNAPEALLGLALGDPNADSVIKACLAVPALRPHYEVLRLKQWLREANLAEAVKLINGEVVMSVSEVNSVEALLDDIAAKLSEDAALLRDVGLLKGWLKGKKTSLLHVEQFGT